MQNRLTAFREQLGGSGVLKTTQVSAHCYCYAEAGTGRPLLLLHGLGGSLYDWRKVMEPLAKSHRVIAVDMLGSGESDMPQEADYSLGAEAARIEKFMDALKIDRATVVGNSFGGGVAMKLAARTPARIEKLVLVDSVCYADVIPFLLKVMNAPGSKTVAKILPLDRFNAFGVRNMFHRASAISKEEIENYRLEISPPARRISLFLMMRALVDENWWAFRDEFRQIRIPTLMIWGKYDRVIPIRFGRKLDGDISGSRFVELPAGHIPNQECPGQFVGTLAKF